MTSTTFRFDRFSLDTGNRQLCNGDEAVDLNSRYFDALVLLVSEHGRLVGKDRFMDEVWRGIPVTDEALTQCIRTLRRQLGDDAAKPRFIETVPKHGYRFIATVEPARTDRTPRAASIRLSRELVLLGGAGTAGGGIAGILGGLFYGFTAASSGAPGEISALIVMLIVAITLGLIGAAAVAFGVIAAASLTHLRSGWTIVGGATGGLLIGALVKVIGVDAFGILFGRSPGDITGAAEGLALGAAVGFAFWLGRRSLRLSVGAGLICGAGVGVLLALIGGHLMGGSLKELSNHFPGSRLQPERIAGLFGEKNFGLVTQAATAALEGAIFTACVVAAMALARKSAERL